MRACACECRRYGLYRWATWGESPLAAATGSGLRLRFQPPSMAAGTTGGSGSPSQAHSRLEALHAQRAAWAVRVWMAGGIGLAAALVFPRGLLAAVAAGQAERHWGARQQVQALRARATPAPLGK